MLNKMSINIVYQIAFKKKKKYQKEVLFVDFIKHTVPVNKKKSHEVTTPFFIAISISTAVTF